MILAVSHDEIGKKGRQAQATGMFGAVKRKGSF